MPKLFNVGPNPVVIGDWSEGAVMPGESHDFTDEQVAAGIAGAWSEEDPRAGLKAEREFKQKRDAKTAGPAQITEPAESGETKE